MSLSITVGKHLEDFVHKKVKSGFYNSASEVVRQGLRLLIEKEKEAQSKKDSYEDELEKIIHLLQEIEKDNEKNKLADKREFMKSCERILRKKYPLKR